MSLTAEFAAARWHPQRPALAELDAWLAGNRDACRRVKDNVRRSVWALAPTAAAPPSVFLKHDHPAGPWDRFVAHLRSKVRREYDSLIALRAAGLPAVEPLACADLGADGLLLTRALPDAVDAADLWHVVAEEPTRRRAYATGLGELARQVLAANLHHPDLHLGNLLAREDGGRIDFTLVDAYGARIGAPLAPAARHHLLHAFAATYQDFDAGDVAAFTTAALPAADEAARRAFWRGLRQAHAADLARRWPGRRRKLRRGDSSLVATTRGELGKWRYRPEVDPEWLEAAIRAHRNLVFNDPGGLIQNTGKRAVSHVMPAGEDAFVKEWRRPGPWGPWSADCRGWLFNWRLELAGFPVPRALGWLRADNGSACVVFEYVAGRPLLHVLDEADAAAREAWLDALFALLDNLYAWGIVHEDLKIHNFIAREAGGAPSLVLTDNDAVLFDRRIGPAERSRNYRHLRGTMPPNPAVVAAFEARWRQEFGSLPEEEA